MKVKELIEILQKCNKEEEIMFNIMDGCCGDTLDLEFEDIQIFDYSSNKEQKQGIHKITPIISFKGLPGYRSCRQGGLTIYNDKKYWENFPSSYRKFFGEDPKKK